MTIGETTWRLLESALGDPPLLRPSCGASASEIAAAASALAVPFSEDYAEFLRRFGAAMVGPYPVYGVGSTDAMGSGDVVSVTMTCRTTFSVALDCIVISLDHGGNPFILHPSGCVTRSDHDFGRTQVIAESLGGFLLYCLSRSGEPLTPQETRLTCSDALVGFVTATGGDNYWILGFFRPGPRYEVVAGALERERDLSERKAAADDDDAVHDAWIEALEAVNDLNLRLGETRVRDFKVDRDGWCEFKVHR